MVWKKVSGATSFWDFKANPMLEGVYLRNHNGKFGLLYDIQTANGPATIASSKTLDVLMQNVPLNATIRVTRAAEKQVLKNGRSGWAWTVEIDESKQQTLGAKQ